MAEGINKMDLIKSIIQKYPEKQNKGNWLELAKKDDRGVPMPYPVDNPVHRVKLIKGENDQKENYRGIKEDGVMLYFDEDGVEKKYFVPMTVNDRNSPNFGKFHYLYERFSDIKEGDLLDMEFVRKGKTGFVDVKRVGVDVDDSEIPIIDDSNVDYDSDAIAS